ncbi:MAG: YihY/virulence factor BrkB family protein [Candidatus Bathyarchaeia archaeon]|jgi:membrane protein
MILRQLYLVFKTAFLDWIADNSPIRAAALSFFIILPLPTLLLIAEALFSLFLGQDLAIQILIRQITAVVGPSVAELFSQLIEGSSSPFSSVWTAVVVVSFSIGGAIGAFSVLRDTMDCIWEVKVPNYPSLWRRIRQKIVPFGVVSALGLIVIACTGIVIIVSDAVESVSADSFLTYIALEITQLVLSFFVDTILLAIIYKMLPEAKVHWRDVGVAALVTGVAFTVANNIFGAYVHTFTVTTVGGVAGSLLIILLWIFVLNQIVLYGAEASKVYAFTMGTHAKKHSAST